MADVDHAVVPFDTERANYLTRENVLEEFKEFKEVMGIIANIENVYNDLIPREMAMERLLFILDEYQEQPHLLDPHLDELITNLLDYSRKPHTPEGVIHESFKYFYVVTKVRGYKVIVRHMPHEVSDVEPVLRLLTEQDPYDTETWETRYVLLLWLSIVCMIPFDMAKLDSNVRLESGDIKKPIMDRILDTVKVFLTVNDKCLDAAAYVVARFMTRPDVRASKLPEFLDWILRTLSAVDFHVWADITKVRGMLSTLASLLKHSKRDDLLPYAATVLAGVHACNLNRSDNTILRKLGVKITQRLGLILLKAKIAAWRYQRGSRSLSDNLTNKASSSKPLLVHTELEDDTDEDYDIPEEIEHVIEQLLTGLKYKDTVVRWSAAKGIGRVTGRLPRELADEVVGSVLELFTKHETDAAWHGGCLALAELGRRGLLLPDRLNEVVPVVLKSLAYDEKRGNFSVGSHVRDAACYVCWAFARAYDPEEIQPYVNKIASALVIVSIFDREINVRRAASAAFQENVGRQGTFPHGIDILTTADYFAVGNRTHCYLELSIFVADFPEYTHDLIDHLIKIKANHWDEAMRDLTAKALYKLTNFATEYMATTAFTYLLPLCTGIDLTARHGAILAVGEIMLALRKNNESFECDGHIQQALQDIVPKLQSAKLFRGVGGELMRKAVCSLIEKLSQAKLAFHGQSVIVAWQEVIDDCLQHLEPNVQSSALDAIPAFFTEYYSGAGASEVQEKVVQNYLHFLEASVETTRIGGALAIGALPQFMLHRRLQKVLDGLIKCTQIADSNKEWAESRKAAIQAVTRLCKTVGFDCRKSPHDALNTERLQTVFDCMLAALHDYTLDSRGDVGAWVREASMVGLQEMVLLALDHNPDLLTQNIMTSVMCCVVQQACEKIDRTRAVAGSVFETLLYNKPLVPHIPHYEELLEIFTESVENVNCINWAVPADTFPLFTKLLQFETYTRSVLLGITVSVGGLTESLVKHSGLSFIGYLRGVTKSELSRLAGAIIAVFATNLKIDRVSIPMFKMLDQLFSDVIFSECEEEQASFPNEILSLSKKEIYRSGDPQKLMASADVFCGLLQFSGKTRARSLTQLMVFLCHRFPRVRKTTANKLYEALVTYDDIVPDESLDEIIAILSETKWDEDLKGIRPLRNNLCDLMGLPKPIAVKKD